MWPLERTQGFPLDFVPLYRLNLSSHLSLIQLLPKRIKSFQYSALYQMTKFEIETEFKAFADEKNELDKKSCH